jgi:type IV pilus assembly protein PilB
MIRQGFLKILNRHSQVTAMDIQHLMADKDKDTITEFELLKIKEFNEIEFAKGAATAYGMSYMDLQKVKVSRQIINMLPKIQVNKYRAIPVQQKEGQIFFAIFDPSASEYSNELSRIFRSKISFLVTNITSWFKLYRDISEKVEDIIDKVAWIDSSTVDPEEESKKNRLEKDIGEEVIRTVNMIMASAYLKKASDIHLEPYEKIFRIRFRVDGELLIQPTPNMNMVPALLSRFKIMAKLDIAERRKPQDGRIKLRIGSETIEFRVSSLPTLHGEKIVLRLLDQTSLQLDLTKLGFEEDQLKRFKVGIYKPYGMCLATGPTGSGKTTTLYSVLSELNTPESNISTAEDPVEYNLEGINQVQVQKDIGFTFAQALRSFLRQDPDVIMVGEIRDQETATIAVEAALTGHMVLSTLHTNDAAQTVTRLITMGVEPFLIAGALNVVVAQRLCRRLCLTCRQQKDYPHEFLMECGFTSVTAEKVKLFAPIGCPSCNETGYRGRVAIYEVLYNTNEMKDLILRQGSGEEIKTLAIKQGMKTLRMSALTKAAIGQTSLEEAIQNSAID